MDKTLWPTFLGHPVGKLTKILKSRIDLFAMVTLLQQEVQRFGIVRNSAYNKKPSCR